MRFFELETEDISKLSDADLRELVGRLSEAELSQQNIQLSCVLWGGAQEAADGGLDVHVKDAGPLINPSFVPSSNTGKTEFRYSLRSRLLRVAKQRARSIAAFIHQLFTRVRNNMEEFTSEQITSLVRQHIKETLKNDERCRSIAEPSMQGKTMLEASSMKSEEAESLIASVNRWLQNNDHALMHPVTKRISSGQGSELDENSETFKTLSRELLKAFQDILRVRIRRAEAV